MLRGKVREAPKVSKPYRASCRGKNEPELSRKAASVLFHNNSNDFLHIYYIISYFGEKINPIRQIYKIYWVIWCSNSFHERKYVYDVSEFFIEFCRGHSRMPRGRFVNRPYETLENQGLLACFFDSNCNCNSHTNHGVVTCADESHHHCELGSFEMH